MEFLLVPLDNRPVTYLFPQLICRVAGVQARVPLRTMMGGLQSPTDPEALGNWLTDSVSKTQSKNLIICLDSIIYGGLINSRRHEDSDEQLLNRCKLIGQLKKNSRNANVLVQSSILRISDNYDHTEEKKYWARYGREIFAWSELMHKSKKGIKLQPSALELAESRIEPAIRQDYLNHRVKNFRVNMKLLDFVAENSVDFLIFSQDDSGEFGLNVLEQERLLENAARRSINRKVLSYAGSDETIMTLIARALMEGTGKRPLASLNFSNDHGSRIPSRYEGQTIGDSVEKQLFAAGLNTTNDRSSACDFDIVIHTADNQQGDHIHLPGLPDLRNVASQETTARTLQLMESSEKPVVLCDLAYANGADPLLFAELFKRPHLLRKLWSFAAWNTSGNALGSAFSLAIARYVGEQRGFSAAQQVAAKEALFVRIADDWAYQTQVRPQLANHPAPELKLPELMQPFLQQICAALEFNIQAVQLKLPWQRTFEVEISIPGPY